MKDVFQVGIISSTHGIKGEVKVFPTTDDINRFKNLKEVILDTGKEQKILEIEGVKFFKQFAILKFKGIDNINDVTAYKGNSLFVTRQNAIKLKENEYFIADLEGIHVESETGESIGTLKEVMLTGANDVYVVEMDDKREVLIPAIKQCILSIDIENKIMKVHLLDGLLD